jgi:hypothetical protein
VRPKSRSPSHGYGTAFAATETISRRVAVELGANAFAPFTCDRKRANVRSHMDDSPGRRAAFEGALGNEYFALSGLRALSIAEGGTRATLYFTTLAGTLLALGFLAGTTDAFTPVAYAAIPTVVILGFLSFLRLVEIASRTCARCKRSITFVRTIDDSFPRQPITSRHQDRRRRSIRCSRRARVVRPGAPS